jgi:hypothetical protein
VPVNLGPSELLGILVVLGVIFGVVYAAVRLGGRRK